MSSVQTSYEKYTRNALAGLVADVGPYEIASRSNKTPANGIVPFGYAVGHDNVTNFDEGCLLGLGGGFLGIAVRQTAKENVPVAGETSEYLTNETVGILRVGSIWVVIDNAGGVAGDPILFDDTTGAISSGLPGAGETEIPNGQLDMAVSGAGEIVRIRIGA